MAGVLIFILKSWLYMVCHELLSAIRNFIFHAFPTHVPASSAKPVLKIKKKLKRRAGNYVKRTKYIGCYSAMVCIICNVKTFPCS
jgi:hypothetical protein